MKLIRWRGVLLLVPSRDPAKDRNFVLGTVSHVAFGSRDFGLVTFEAHAPTSSTPIN